MQKFIRIVLPWVCIAVIIGCFKYDIDLRWLIGAAGICGVSYAILYVKLHKIEGGRGRCVRIGESKGQLIEKGDGKAQVGKRICQETL